MRRILVVLVVGTLLSVAGLPPTSADQRRWKDPGGGADSLLDIRAVKVRNNAAGVRIVIRISPVDWDERNPTGLLNLRIDTLRRSPGPELADDIGFPGHGGFRGLKGSKKDKASWHTYPFPGKCGKSVVERFDVAAGQVRILIRPKKGCLHHPKRVRVHVRTVQTGHFAEPGYEDYTENVPRLIDHFPARGRYSSWVRYSRR